MTTIDWEGTGAMLQGIGTILGAIMVGGAAWLGSRTYQAWRQQKLSERRMEQAERILTATYKVRRSLQGVRSPAMFAHETDKAEEMLRETGEWQQVSGEEDQNKLAYAKAYYNRLDATRDDQRALEECQPMARALFGEKLEAAVEKLNHQFWTVSVYVGANHRDKADADRDFRRKIESTIWTGYPNADENEMDQIIADQVKTIEDICVPVLRLDKPFDRAAKSTS